MKTQKILTFYNYINKSLEDNKNPIMDLIINKPKWYEIKERLFIRNFKLYLSAYYTPSFDFLESITDFIILAENTFMYPNFKGNDLFAYRNTKNETKSFMVTVNERINDQVFTHTIEYTLFKRDNNRINIKISRKWGDNIATNISFYANQDMNLSINDQIMFNDIISDTMSNLINVFDYCMNKAKPLDYKGDNSEDSFTHS